MSVVDVYQRLRLNVQYGYAFWELHAGENHATV